MSEGMISCCGVVCSRCKYYPEDCKGCPAIAGKAFWLEYTGGEVCDIYHCCIEEKGLAHCGLCAQLPCAHYDGQDPTMTPAENEASFRAQMELLQKLADAQA